MSITVKGTENPKIYFIEEINHETNMSFSGDFVVNVLDSLGLNENNCRFTSIVLENSDNIKSIHDDILKTNPNMIVSVGSQTSKDLIGSKFKNMNSDHGELFESETDLGFNGYKNYIIPVYHPGYINRQDSQAVLKSDFINDIKKAVDICINGVSISNYKYNNYEDNTVLCLNYEDFDNFCKEEIDNADIISYDVESNAEEPTSERYEIVGFSLASRSNKGCYVCLNSLDYKIPEFDKKLVEARLRKILINKSSIITYNCMHEIMATLNWLNIEVLNNIDDVFTTVKLMMGNANEYQGNGGLKKQCQMNLKVNDWSEDLDKYFQYLRDFKNCEDEMKSLLLNYYDVIPNNSASFDPLINDIMKKVEDAYNDPDTFKNKVISYGLVPCKLIGKYGGTDSSILFDLKRYYDEKILKLNNELNIDLNEGYKHWMNHHRAGYILERNGANWNDKRASKLEKWCEDGMKISLSNLVKSPLSEPFIKHKVESWFLNYLKENYLEEILGKYAIPKRLFKNSVNIELIDIPNNELKSKLNRMSLEPKVKKDGTVTNEYKLELGHIQTLSKEFLDNNPKVYSDWYSRFIEEFKGDNKTVSELKQLINPTATGKDFKEFVSNTLITDDIRYAKFYLDIARYVEDPNFSIDNYKNDYFKDDVKLFSLIINLENSDNDNTTKFRLFKKFLDNGYIFNSRKLKDFLSDSLNYKLDSFEEGYILELYDMFCLCGLDIEDESTWSDEFEWLYNFRKYKKFSKIISTYVKGRVGRNSVWTVDKESFERGDKLTKREKHYYELSEEEINSDDKAMVLQTDFFVDAADTGRWKATMHTIPAGPTVKGIITSRFKGGVIFCPDCSQAEVRVLAAQSNDENLINAFMQDGMDIHRFVASLCFKNGDMEAVTDVERKIAKGAVFGILYGESVKSFADTYTHGDLDEAEKIFNYFYTAFPGIKDYVEESHKEFDNYQKISLPIMNRFIDMEPVALDNGDDKSRIYRQCQNYKIQGQTCDLAGLILYNICKYIEDNNLKSKVFCFIHDSIEIDVHPDETFLMADMLKPLFNKYPYDKFKVPMASDIVVGASMGQESDINILEHDEEYNNVKIELEGFEDDIDELIEIWNDVYDKVEVVNKDLKKEEYVPLAGLFQKKVVISEKMGTTRKKISCEMNITRKL